VVAGTTFKITGVGKDPVGQVIPEGGEEKLDGDVKQNAHHTALLAGLLCSNAKIFKDDNGRWQADGNASEIPIVVAGAKVGLDIEQVHKRYPKLHENAFSSARKMMSVLRGMNDDDSAFVHKGPCVAFVKGAPNRVIDHCTGYLTRSGYDVREFTEKDKNDILKVIDEFSDQALRVLAFGYRVFDHEVPDQEMTSEHLEEKLVFVGLIASIDPEREAVKPSIQECYNAGVRVVMITGDYVKTAKAIAVNIGLLPPNPPDNSYIDCGMLRPLGSELLKVDKSLAEKHVPNNEKEELQKRKADLEAKIDAITSSADVYARAEPSDKNTIVFSFKRQGLVCSMTGDGVNDAPALKNADIGVAMGITGTGVAKGAAAMILTDDDFCSIVKAIEEGRTIYANITKFCFYLLSTNIAEVFVVLISVLIGYPPLLETTQILWLNLTTDGAPAIALAVEPTEENIMDEGPRPANENILEKVMLTGIFIHFPILTILCIGLYVLGLSWHCDSIDPTVISDMGNEAHCILQAKTMVILFIVFAELGRAYTCRSIRQSVFRIGWASNIWMFYSIFGAVFLTILIYFIPGLNDAFKFQKIGGKAWGAAIGFAFIPMIMDELVKWIYRLTKFGERPKVPRYQIPQVSNLSPRADGFSRLIEK